MAQFQTDLERYIRLDPYAAQLGAELVEVSEGYSRVVLRIRPEHHNFHGMTHGGVIFSLGDIAFAAASNSRGQTAVALNVDVSFLKATVAGDELVAECKELSLNGPIGLYEITVRSEPTGDLVAQSQAMVYRKRDRFIDPAQ